MISGQLEDVDQVGEISRRSVGKDNYLHAADEQRAMEDILLQNTLKHTIDINAYVHDLLSFLTVEVKLGKKL